MNRAQRIDLILKAATNLATREWPHIDLVLRTFDLPWSDNWDGDKVAYCMAHIENASDGVLTELSEYLGGEPALAAMGSAGPWLADHLHLFLASR